MVLLFVSFDLLFQNGILQRNKAILDQRIIVNRKFFNDPNQVIRHTLSLSLSRLISSLLLSSNDERERLLYKIKKYIFSYLDIQLCYFVVVEHILHWYLLSVMSCLIIEQLCNFTTIFLQQTIVMSINIFIQIVQQITLSICIHKRELI